MIAGLLVLGIVAQPAAAENPPASSSDTTSTATQEASPDASAVRSEASDPTEKTSATATVDSSPSEESTPTVEPEESNPPAASTPQVSKRMAPSADDDAKPILGIKKSHDKGEDTLKPGDAITYELVIQCQGLKVDCVNYTVTDVLPEGLDVVSLPKSIDGDREVNYDEDTRELRITFLRDLQVPAGEKGLTAGSTVNLQISMRLPADTDLTDGTTITNTADAKADNADPKSDSVDVVVEVPRTVTPVATKDWSGTAVAGTRKESTSKLGIRNASSTSAEVTELVIIDDSEATFEHFDFTGASLTRFPDGADAATVRVKTATDWVDAGTYTETGDFTLPGGVSAADVVGLEVTFTNADGDILPVSATPGTVEMGLVLRGTFRSSDEALRPTNRVDVENCAIPGATDSTDGEVQGEEACSKYFIQPDTLVLKGAKTFFPDTDGSFNHDNGEHAVVGLNSPVTGKIKVTNESPFPIQSLTITEPDPNGSHEFDKLDVTEVRPRFPDGATSAEVVITYDDGEIRTFTGEHRVSIDVVRDGKRVTNIEITFTGGTGEEPTIEPGSTSGLYFHGTLNDLVTDEDLPDGTSPGVDNCAAFEGSAGRTDGTGTAVGSACDTLQVEAPRHGTGVGVKDVSQTSIPEGQPVDFNLRVNNNGNRDMVNPVINDPQVQADGTPVTPNIFDSLRITGASVARDGNLPDVVIEVFDSGDATWKSYDASDADLLERSTGIRARMEGGLPPTKSFTLRITVERRDGVQDDVELENCFTTSAGEGFPTGDPACSPGVATGPASAGASLNKSISPGTLPKYVPGLPKQYADVGLRIQNNGNLSAQSLQVIDEDADFFDAVDFVKIQSAKMPAGANRVQVDALVDGDWVNGSPAASPTLPSDVSAADVRGIRATFTSTGDVNKGYTITPCSADSCAGTLVFQVSPRESLRSNPETIFEGTLIDKLTGTYLTNIDKEHRPVGPVDATLTVTDGKPQLGVDKSPDTNLQPGEPAPFRLKVTNTGTANLAGLVVNDSLPQGIEFNSSATFPDTDSPFRVVGVDVPEGTPLPPTPVFTTTNDGERVSELSWDFTETADGQPWLFAPGATLTIEIQVKLEAGVNFGDVVTNTMGATGTSPGLTCDKPGDDSVFGENFCTDTASLKVLAGAAFDARKWVSGNESLGWYNTFTNSPVEVGDNSCPAAKDASGLTYTSFPCIALVNPGDQFKYMLRLTNAGTESGTNMRIIDRFPVEGDRGVNIDQARGTQWNNRPTLASEPQLEGPGTMTTTYTTGQDLCIMDLDMGDAGSSAEQCPAGAWNDPYGADVTAAKFDLTFDPTIKPGERVDITFDMDTPLEVAQVSDPTVAWNSFAHAETTDRNGKPNVLPVTEPIQVGVATSYGSLELQKTIGENPAELDLADREFEFKVVCTTTPQGRNEMTVVDKTLDVSSTTPGSITDIPAGASCSVWETDAQGGISSNDEDNPLVIDIEPMLGTDAQTQTSTITNDFPLTQIAVTKVVDGDAAEFAPASFPVDITCTFDGEAIEGYDPLGVTVTPGEDTVVDVPTGSACSAVETNSGMATEVTYLPASEDGKSSAPVESEAGTTGEVSITNTFRAGGIVVHKEVTGSGTPELAQGPFGYTAECTFNGQSIDREVTIAEGEGEQVNFVSEAITGLPAGAECTVTETDNGGADFTPAPIDVVIEADENVTVGFTGESSNRFSSGTIGLSKELGGDAAEESWATDATFQVAVTCEREVTGEDEESTLATVFSRTVAIKGGETIDALTDGDGNPVKLPVGTRCHGEETETAGATSFSVSPDNFDDAQPIETTEDPSVVQALSVTATNVFEYGSVELFKEIDGDAVGYVGDREFTLDVSCVLPQAGVDTVIRDAEPITIKGGESVVIADLPVAAECWAAESDQGGATEVAINHGDRENAAVVGEDEAVAITVTNSFAAAELTVGKTVVNGPAGPYGFALTCTTDQGDVALAAEDASFQLEHGETRTISVPVGADCAVEESAAGATVSFEDSDDTGDGRVIVDGHASVQVTNTFPVKPGEPGKPGGAGLPNTGGPSMWLLTVGLLATAGGAGVLINKRRRA